LVEAAISEEALASCSETQAQLLYSMALVRLVNGFVGA
jgi:hypothetical protein